MTEGKPIMPTQVRVFWWLSIAIVVYSIVLTVFALQSVQHHDLLPTALSLPEEVRERTFRTDLLVRITSMVVRSGLILCLAWLSAFRRLNWARWGLVFLFLIQGAYEIWGAIQFHQLSGPAFELVKKGWWAYIFLILAVAASSCVFSERAQAWFDKPR